MASANDNPSAPPGDAARAPRPRLWIVLDLNPKKRGSLEEGLVALAARLRAAPVEVTIVFSRPPIDWLRAALVEHGVAIRVLDFRRPLAAARDFAAWLRSSPPSLVHFHFVRAHSPLVVLAHAAGARVVVHDHLALQRPAAARGLGRRTERRLVRGWKWLRASVLDRCVDRRLAVSAFVARTLTEAEFFPPGRIEVLPNGVEMGRFLRADAMTVRWERNIGARPVVACVARMSREKGVDVLLRAAARLPAEAVLVIAGDGPEAAACQALAQGLGLGERTHFLGLRNDVENVYAAADVVVMPSRCDEAFGLSVVEAMAAGKPVVVSDSGAMPEIVGGCGLVVPKGNEPALADAIAALLADGARREALGQAARQRAVGVYPVERWVDGVVAAYARLLPSLDVGAELIDFDPTVRFLEPDRPTDTPRVVDAR